jgi:hypothetical protein
MRLALKSVTALSAVERGALERLTTAVYPPEALATNPGRLLEWAADQSSILVWAEDGKLVGGQRKAVVLSLAQSNTV